MQCLFHCKCFLREVKRLLPLIEEASPTALRVPPRHLCILQDYQNLYENSASRLHYTGNCMHEGRQEDAQEFLSKCVNCIGSDGSPLTRLWTGAEEKQFRCPEPSCRRWQYELVCKAEDRDSCGKRNPLSVKLLQLYVQQGEGGSIERFTDLQGCINHYEREHQMEVGPTYDCVHCGLHCDKDSVIAPLEKASLTELPELLMIHLRRFERVNGVVKKVSHRVDFPDRLPLGNQSYKLRGVVYHGGATVSSGHYWAYVSISDNSWVLCDDWVVRPAAQGAPWQCRVGHPNPVVYLMFYERVENSGAASSQTAVTG